MIGLAVAWSARHPWVVIVAALLVAAAGGRAWGALSRDVLPDLADPQIAVVADWMGHPASEVARAVTNPLSDSLEGVAGAKAVRGLSMSGMAYVDVVFASTSRLEEGRQAIRERVAEIGARLPPGVRMQVGPAASSTGWVFEYALFDPTHTVPLPMIRRFQDEVFRPALAAIPGVAEVATVGGGVEELLIEPMPDRLRDEGLAFTDVLAALRPLFAAGQPPRARSGAAFEHLCARCDRELEAVPLGRSTTAGVPMRLRDVARVRFTDDMPTGFADFGGQAAVGGIVVARRDADLFSLVSEVKRALDRERHRLPASVRLETAYDRLDLANRVNTTLFRALGEEIAVVVLVIVIFLLHGRSALVPIVTLPVVVLMTFGGMWLLGVPATIMSLGGICIALGLAVDADIVALEASHRRLEAGGATRLRRDRRAGIAAAAQSFAPAVVISLSIAALSFLPVFAFTGESGRLLRPLALTKTLVVASATLVALTLAPALRDRVLRGPVTPEFENPLTRFLVQLYRPFVRFALTRPALTLTTGVLAVASCLPILSRLGGEFLPRVDEGDVLFMPTTLAGVGGDEAAAQLSLQDRALGAFGEVSSVFGKVGRADTATDPAPYSMAETTIRLRPRSEWPKIERPRWYSGWAPEPLRRVLGGMWPEKTSETPAALVGRLDRAAHLPGWTSAWTAPARARMDMMSTGVRTPIGIRIVSPDPHRLDELGSALRDIAMQVPGARSAAYEALGGETWLGFEVDPARLTRFGVDAAIVQSTVDLLTTGGQLGEVQHEGQRLRVRISPGAQDGQGRGPADELRAVTVRATSGGAGQADLQDHPIPLALLGRPAYERVPATLRTEHGQLVAYVDVDLDEGADLRGYVQRARREVDAALAGGGELRLQPGERIEWTGQYELMMASQARLKWIVPVVLVSMVLLLFLQFRNLTEAFLVVTSVPFALVGSFWTLFVLDYPLSAPVWVGLLSVVGLAMQTSVVMVVYIDDAFYRRVHEGTLRTREDIVAAHEEGTVQRLRPKIMTVAAMTASLLPLLWAHGGGAEIMRRVAAPMIGGLVTSAFLTLEILPVLYTIWRQRQLRRAQRTGVSIAAVVGVMPAWARPPSGLRTPRAMERY